jgi:ATP-binding protein involved in chromosome partitioning
MAKELSIPVIGVVENMSGFVCPHCGKEIYLFGKGGGKKLAQEMSVNFLGCIPIDTDVCLLSDKGVPIVMEKQNSEVAKAYELIVESINTQVGKQSKEKEYA